MEVLLEWVWMALACGLIVLLGATGFVFLVIVPFLWLVITVKDVWDNL